jgi:hypothetical protein
LFFGCERPQILALNLTPASVVPIFPPEFSHRFQLLGALFFCIAVSRCLSFQKSNIPKRFSVLLNPLHIPVVNSVIFFKQPIIISSSLNLLVLLWHNYTIIHL